jgi:hypothetical protein
MKLKVVCGKIFLVCDVYYGCEVSIDENESNRIDAY